MKRLFHIGDRELRCQVMLGKGVLLCMALLFIGVHGLLAAGDGARPDNNDANGDAAISPVQQDDTSNVSAETKQADRDFLKQVEAWDAKRTASISDSPTTAGVPQSPDQPAAPVHRAERTARLHLNQRRDSSSLALAGHRTSTQKMIAANSPNGAPGATLFLRIIHTALHPRL